MSDLACRTLGMLQKGAMIDPSQRGRIMRAYHRDVWTLITGQTLPEWQGGLSVLCLRTRAAGDAEPFSVAELTPSGGKLSSPWTGPISTATASRHWP